MSINEVNGKTAMMGVMGIMASLLAYMFYGRIQDASDIQTIKQELVQAKSERVDLWGMLNARIEKDADMMMKSADYMVADAIEKGEIRQEIQRVELDNANEWKKYYKEKE